MQKTPYMLVLGDKEAAEGTVAVRSRRAGDLGTMNPDDLMNRLLTEIATKAR